jgi:hypothetical protein
MAARPIDTPAIVFCSSTMLTSLFIRETFMEKNTRG